MRTNDVIGLIPCGGHATRIAPLPCSKEVLPVGLRRTLDGSLRPKVVSHYLLEKMRVGGMHRAFFILRKGKWDIPEYYGDGAAFGMDLGYLMMGRPYGPSSLHPRPSVSICEGCAGGSRVSRYPL